MKAKDAVLFTITAFLITFGLISFVNFLFPQDLTIADGVILRLPLVRPEFGVGVSAGVAFMTFLQTKWKFFVAKAPEDVEES